MRKNGTNSEVTNAFINGNDGPWTTGNGNLYFSGDVLYSYGSHFPICYKTEKGLFLVNGDKYSISTSQHQSEVQSALRGKKFFTTSFSALQSARIYFKTVEIVDYTKELSVLFGEKPDKEDYPAYVNISKVNWSDKWHVHAAATALFRQDGIYFIAGMDEFQYFVSRLPGKPRTIEKAFESLKPLSIRRLEKSGVHIKRQGEWFCFPVVTDTKEARAIYEDMNRDFQLPHELHGNPHTATRGMRKGKQFLISGGLRHNEHRTLRVSKADRPEIWQAVCNTAKGNWSSDGRVD